MKLQKRLLIMNTINIFVCLIMLLLVVGIVTNIFRTQYMEDLFVENFERKDTIQRPYSPEPQMNREEMSRIAEDAVSNFYLSLMCSAIIAILIIVLISQTFTKKIVDRIMIPIDKLMEANKRVENGNYNEQVEYKGEYEFEQLCTSFNKMQKSLKDEKELNRKEQKSKEDMITGISHDLRTPLTSIKGYIKGLRDGVAATKEKQEQYLEVAYTKACEMDVLIEKLFNFSQLETGEIPYNMKKEHIGTLVNEYLNSQELYLKENGINLRTFITTDEEINVDKEQLTRVFSNIIYNSIKYANVKDLIIKFNVRKQGNNIIIEIKDNGKGVEQEKIDRIFEEFYRCDESRTNSSKEGNGLGLYICKRIIKKHNGIITAENDNGLKITIELPIGE